jgi:DNA mismatch repair protein MutL
LGSIHILGENISNKIAAGEVIERPASVVKELVENSIDAGSSSITVEIRDGGISFIRITDNGSGMDEEDSRIAFIRHSTSKIISEGDLNNIKTLGFRGEALASIASVSQIEMLTKLKSSVYGTRTVIEGGNSILSESAGCPDGTTIIVKNLFYNTPARLKFLKKESREGTAVSEIMYNLTLSRPDIGFRFINNNKMIFNTSGDGNLKNTILNLFGKEVYESLIKINYKGNILSISGYIGEPSIARSNRNYQIFFINNRYIKSRMLSVAVDNAYKTFLTINKFAFCIISISICPELVDVNVHPTKAEVRFQDEKEVFSAIFNTVRNSLAGEVLIPDSEADNNKKVEQIEVYKINIDNPPVIKEERFNNSSINMVNLSKNIDDEEKVLVQMEDIVSCSDDLHDDKNPVGLMPPLIVIGQYSSTYILCDGPDGLYIIDQHAAHERILYEKFKFSFEKGGVESQSLIVPIVVDLTQQEVLLVKDNLSTMERLGFTLEFFGVNSIMLRSVPVLFGEPQLKKFFIEIVDSLDGNEPLRKSSTDNAIYTMACKSAIKAHDRLSIKEMEGLIKSLRQTKNPYTCPHGRPTIIRMTENELEKKFKRIQ